MINPTNSNIILFGSNSSCAAVHLSLNIKMYNKYLVLFNDAKNVGVIIDSDIIFNIHFNILIQGAYSLLKLLIKYEHRNPLPHNIKITLSETLV